MKLFFQRISYKVLVSTMITIALSFFVVTSYSHANKFSELVNEDGIYYTGVQSANSVTVGESFLQKAANTLASVASLLVGLITFAIRGVFIGWIEIFELILTAMLNVDESILADGISALTINYTDTVVSVEKIIFGKVEILDANIFKNIGASDSKSIVGIIKNAVAKWYYILRLFAIAFMLIFLIFIGIKMAISTIASEKAIYKQMLVDWVVGMIIVFSIHYAMILIFSINDNIVEALDPLLSEKASLQEEYEYGIENKKLIYEDMEKTLYESARTRAYSLSALNGFTGMVIYGVLVYYAWRFAIMYFMRVINIMILTMMAPIIAVSYAMNKVISGKSKIFSNWLSEYIMNVSIQVFHVIIYVSFVSIALKLSMQSLLGTIIAFVLLHLMLKMTDLLRSLFKMSGGKGSLAGTMANTGFKEMKKEAEGLKDAVVGGQIGVAAMKQTYRLASKPIRVGAEAAFTKHMAKKAQKADEEKKEEEENQRLIQEKIDELNQQKAEKENEKTDYENEMKNKSAELAKIQKKIDDKELDKAETYNQGYTDNSQEIKDIQEDLDKLYRERQKIEKEIEEAIEKREETTKNLDDINDEIETEQDLQEYEKLRKQLERETFQGRWDNLWDPSNYVERARKTEKVKIKDDNGKKHKITRDQIDKNGHYVYKKDKNGNYVYRKVKTRREGGENSAFWRKKTDSIGKRFFENGKLQDLLGIDDKEKKELEKQAKFWTSSILGIAAATVGFPALVINPALGIGLLGQATVSGLNYATKKRQFKNRPSYKKTPAYKVTNFNRGAQYTMKVEAARQIKRMQSQERQDFAQRHPEVMERILRGATYEEAVRNGKEGWMKRQFRKVSAIDNERLEVLGELKYRKRLKTVLSDYDELEKNRLTREYRNQVNEVEQEEKQEAEKLSIKELMFNENYGADNVVGVGDALFGINLDDKAAQKQNEFIEEVDKIDKKTTITREQKIKQIRRAIDNNKQELIQNQITKYFARRGINDISNTGMSEQDVTQIKLSILSLLEEKGLIKKGEIKLGDNLISSTDVTKEYNILHGDKDKTNKTLEQKISADAILEYMQKNGIKDPKKLQSDLAKDEIYDIIKDKMMTDSEKVVKQMTGKDAIKLSDDMKDAVKNNTRKVRKVNLDTNMDKEKLVERETNRRMNERKNQVEEAIYADTIDNITDEKTLEMLFTASELMKNNREAVETGRRKAKVTKQDSEMLDFYQDGSRMMNSNNDGSRRFDSSRDGSRRLDPNKDGSRRVVETLLGNKKEAMARSLDGVSDLLGNDGRKVVRKKK